jgi:hypothetical protein
MREAVATVAGTVDAFRKDVDQMSVRLQETATATAAATQGNHGGVDQQNESQRTGTSYADVTRDRGRIPAEHAASIAKGDMRERQIVIQTDLQASMQSLASLSERELVEKANVAWDMMDEGPEEKPGGVVFVGAAKTRIGSVIYTMISDAAAKYRWERCKSL